MTKRVIWILFVAATILLWSCIDKYVDDGERHYETGVVAFNDYEVALYDVASLSGRVNDLNSFIEYVDENTLADGSNSLEVWQTAENEFFPDYRLRENSGEWYLAANGDTILVIDTKNTDFNSPGAQWEAYLWAYPSAVQNFDYLGENSWSLTLNDLNTYYLNPYDYEPFICIDEARLTVNICDGGIDLSGEMTVLPLSSVYSEGEVRSDFILAGTIVKAVWEETEYIRGIFTEASYSFTITDNSSGKTEPVSVSITPVGDNGRTVEIIYKNDTVIQ